MAGGILHAGSALRDLYVYALLFLNCFFAGCFAGQGEKGRQTKAGEQSWRRSSAALKGKPARTKIPLMLLQRRGELPQKF